MKIQIAVTISADGFLSPTGYQSPWWFRRSKHSITALRKNADLVLSKNESAISLLNQKQNKVPITYFAEATSDMMELIKGLLLYRLVDELYLYVLSDNIGNGTCLYDLIIPSEWVLIEKHSLPGGSQCLVYHQVK